MSKFSDDDIALAQKVQSEYGVPASVTLAQYALESGYGKSTVGNNNFFNIKGNGTGGYRDYSSKEESFLDFGKLLSTERYTSKTSKAETVEEYVKAVKAAGYAEDPNYTDKVLSIINTNDLTQYDTARDTITTTVSEKNNTDLKWWGDIVVVVFSILLVLAGIIFVVLIFVDKDKITSGIASKVKGVLS